MGALALGAFSLPALADGEPSGPAAAYAPAGFNWSGLYVGLDGGYAWGDVEGVFDSAGADSALSTLDTDSGLVGVHIGYDHQIGNFVIGVEGDYMEAFEEDSLIDSEDDKQETGLESLTSIRGRLGYAFGPALIYATAGYAKADFELSVENETGEVEFDEDGVVYGGGFAWALAPNVSLRGEYLRYDVDGGRVDLRQRVLPDNDEGDFVEFDDIEVVRAGLTFHLNAPRHEAPLK